MKRSLCRLGVALYAAALLAANGFAQQSQQAPEAPQALTWQDIQARFQSANPSLLAGQIGIDESRAQEISAYLRPNPNLAVLLDQIAPFDNGPDHGPFAYLLPSATVSYLHERRHKRELRLENAQNTTKIAISNQDDLRQKSSSSTLRHAFVQPCRPKPCWRWPKKIWLTTTRCSTSAATATKPAILPRSTWTAWSCSASSTNPISRTPP